MSSENATTVQPDPERVNKILNYAIMADSLMAFLAGLGIGLYALAAPLGVWFGYWDFGRGFQMLQSVNEWAATIGVIAMIVAIGVFAVGTLRGLPNTMVFFILAVIGTASAAGAYFVPESFRPPEGTPPIHDITTDTVNVPQYVAIAPLRADAPNSMEYGSGRDMTAEKLAALQQEAYPEIQPQRFSESKNEIFQRTLAAVEQLGWELVASDEAEGRIEATDTTYWFRFKDDVVIIITEEANETVLNARSLSRVGVSDVGKNAARLNSLFDLL